MGVSDWVCVGRCEWIHVSMKVYGCECIDKYEYVSGCVCMSLQMDVSGCMYVRVCGKIGVGEMRKEKEW